MEIKNIFLEFCLDVPKSYQFILTDISLSCFLIFQTPQIMLVFHLANNQHPVLTLGNALSLLCKNV